MKSNLIVERLRNHNGQHLPVQYIKRLATLQGSTDTVERVTTCYVRAGIDYANLSSVKEGIESGERAEVGPLAKSNVWAQAPYIIRNIETGVEKVRFYPPVFANLSAKTSVEYFLNGKPATLEQVRPLCLAREFRPKGACFDVPCDNVVSVG